MTHTILVLENRHGVSEVIRIALENEGYRVAVTVDTTTAWDMILSERPDILIFGMDVPHNFELIEKLQNERPLPDLAVIALQTMKSESHSSVGWHERRYRGIDVAMSSRAKSTEVVAFVKRIFNSAVT